MPLIDPPLLHRIPSLFTKRTVAGVVALCFVMIGTLWWLGRIPWCECGIGLWTSRGFDPATSQHLADPYSFTHILHGFLFFGALWLFARRVSVRKRFLVATTLEAAWEVLENTPFIINRYRSETASIGYTGDSILNSTGDLLFFIIGFSLAHRLPWKWTALFMLLIEWILLLTLRDNLTLNILMLLMPLPAIQEWQMGR